MATQEERLASDVFAIIEEPTAQMGPIRTVIHKLLAPFGGQLIPRGTHPVVVEKATGKRVKGSAAVLSTMIEGMETDLETMSVREFRSRYLDV